MTIRVTVMGTLTKMKTGPQGLHLIKQFEGLRLESYQDSVGIWTIGYGHTKGVKEGDVITPNSAEDFLRDDLVEAEQAVLDLVEVPLTQEQFDALVSFTFNLGYGNLGHSTLLKMLNASDYEGASEQLLRWDKAGGKTLVGLTKRRQAEQRLFNGGIEDKGF